MGSLGSLLGLPAEAAPAPLALHAPDLARVFEGLDGLIRRVGELKDLLVLLLGGAPGRPAGPDGLGHGTVAEKAGGEEEAAEARESGWARAPADDEEPLEEESVKIRSQEEGEEQPATKGPERPRQEAEAEQSRKEEEEQGGREAEEAADEAYGIRTEQATRYVESCGKVYKFQIDNGRYFSTSTPTSRPAGASAVLPS